MAKNQDIEPEVEMNEAPAVAAEEGGLGIDDGIVLTTTLCLVVAIAFMAVACKWHYLVGMLA